MTIQGASKNQSRLGYQDINVGDVNGDTFLILLWDGTWCDQVYVYIWAKSGGFRWWMILTSLVLVFLLVFRISQIDDARCLYQL